jgi:hypothetical protein
VADLRVLLTNCWLAERGGTELYVRDLAIGLLRAGHRPAVWSPILGEVAADLRAAGIPVFDDLAAVAPAPDLVHCQHGDETRAALSRFPDVPGVYVQHDAEAWQDQVPSHPRLLRWAAVDELCRERLLASGIDPDRVSVVPNSVDLERFPRREPLPVRPRRALLFANTAREDTYLPVVRDACATAGLELDVAGIGVGAVTQRPEELLVRYDLVLAKGRAALEALAVGCAVVVLDQRGIAGMVTSDRLPEWRRWNLGRRLLSGAYTVARLVEELDRYDPLDAARCTDLVRGGCGLDGMVESLVSLYTDALDDWRCRGQPDARAELATAAAALATIGPLRLDVRLRDAQLAAADSIETALRGRAATLEAEVLRLASEAAASRAALDDILGGRTIRWRNAVVQGPLDRFFAMARDRNRKRADPGGA